jgi:phosphotransferase system enzyme I (PtsP)
MAWVHEQPALVSGASSMPPAGIGPVKQMVLSCDRAAARRGVESLLKGGGGSVRNEIETLARKLYVAI